MGCTTEELRIQNLEFRKGNGMSRDIQERTFAFACAIVRFHRVLVRKGGEAKLLSRQLLRSGTSVGANMEEANAAHSRADFVCKARIALKEARETLYWLRLLVASDCIDRERTEHLLDEAHQLVAILTSILKKTNANSASGIRESPAKEVRSQNLEKRTVD